MSLAPLNYERHPPIGNSLIDDDGGDIFIRILPERTLGRAMSWGFAACGVGVLGFALAQMTWTLKGLLVSVPVLSAGLFCFLTAIVLRYTQRANPTVIHATLAGIEYEANGFAPRLTERAKIVRVFTRGAPLSKQLFLGVKLVDGGEIVLGLGEEKEIEAMARALHRVLNSGPAMRET